MNDATRDPIGADARPATFDAWANEYCYGLFNDGDDGARVARLAARDAWDAAAATEREACAKLCDSVGAEYHDTTSIECGRRIRARSAT